MAKVLSSTLRAALDVLFYILRGLVFTLLVGLAALGYSFFSDWFSLGHYPSLTTEYLQSLALIFSVACGVSTFSYILLKDPS